MYYPLKRPTGTWKNTCFDIPINVINAIILVLLSRQMASPSRLELLVTYCSHVKMIKVASPKSFISIHAETIVVRARTQTSTIRDVSPIVYI